MDNNNSSKYNDAIGALISWMETWCTEENAYNGFVIHRFENKRMNRIHDTPWTQAAVIRGYVNLYNKTGEKCWSAKAVAAATLQFTRYDNATNKYIYCGHEDDRFHSLVHCALANSALLDSLEIVDKSTAANFIEIVKDNIDNYWLNTLWVDDEGAFKFSEIDFFSRTEDRFVVNFNMMAAECLLKLGEKLKDKYYIDIAIKLGDWLITKLNLSKQGFSERNKISMGLPYQFSESQKGHENCVVLYTGLALRGITALYSYTSNDEFKKIAVDAYKYITNMRDETTRLLYHTTQGKDILKYPQFVSGVGMILVGLDEVNKISRQENYETLVEDVLSTLISYQHPNGSFPSFIGKHNSRSKKSDGLVWEDVAASMSWNSQLFEFLSRVVEPKEIVINRSKSRFIKLTSRFFYYDSNNSVVIFSWFPLHSTGLYVMKKRGNYALIAINPQKIYAFLRKVFIRH